MKRNVGIKGVDVVVDVALRHFVFFVASKVVEAELLSNFMR